MLIRPRVVRIESFIAVERGRGVVFVEVDGRFAGKSVYCKCRIAVGVWSYICKIQAPNITEGHGFPLMPGQVDPTRLPFEQMVLFPAACN